MPVSDTHPDYDRALCRYNLIRSIINNDAKHLIRKPDTQDADRNRQYREDAILTNFTNLTCNAFVGLVFKKEPTLNIPVEIQYLEDDATGTGINMTQFSQHSVSELLQVGRYGYLIDYNNDAQKAFIKPYKAENILNWKAKEVNGVVRPWLITLLECVVNDEDDMFCQETRKQYRVLLLVDGMYQQWIYNEGLELIEQIIPLDSNGMSFDYIPFIFVGSENNDWEVDNQPLYDMAVLNLGHYRNSADYEESIFICGQPYLVVNVGDASAEEFVSINPNGVMYGSRKGLVLANGGSATLLQANPNQLVAQAMNEKLDQAAKIGARIIEPAGGRETAEAARIRYGSQNSVLSTLATNVSDAIEDALEIICQFMGIDDESVEFELHTDFYEDTADGNIMNSYLAWFDKGLVSVDEIREYGRKTGLLDQNNIVVESSDNTTD